ncbi:MAG TPA: ABC transporter permease subunit [Planctomycetota bacterium]|nr:ABC transporter permease subunit [Planctomycetota bacterium]
MSAAPPNGSPLHAPPPPRPGLTEPAWVRWLLIGIVVSFLGCFLLLPLAVVFVSAFAKGFDAYVAALSDPIAWSAIRLTLLAAGVSVVLNTLFGVAAAWAVTRFRFVGKSLLISLIDLPFAVSPVISGLIFVLLFGAQGWAQGKPVGALWPIAWWALVLIGVGLIARGAVGLPDYRLAAPRRRCSWARIAIGFASIGVALAADRFIQPWLAGDNDLAVIFAWPGIVLATVFVTFPFVARELIPVMQSVGQEEEQAALSLGASGWTTFWRVTMPNVKWGLLYGIILCNARAMGEFGAVSVVSGHIRGQTNTMPLHIEILFNEYQFAAAFAVASILALLALVTLALKTFIESRIAAIDAANARDELATE